MPNETLIGHRASVLYGTIPAGGTLSTSARYNSGGTVIDGIDLDESALLGIIVTSTMTLGTLTFQVSDDEDGPWYDVKDSGGSAESFGPLSGTFALKGDELAFLAPYRYVRIKTSVAQSSGLSLVLPVKA